MLLVLDKPTWWFMEIPKTGTTAVCHAVNEAPVTDVHPYEKHWPVDPPDWFMETNPRSMTSVRNPYNRAISCWFWCYASGKSSVHRAARKGFEIWLKEALHNRDRYNVTWLHDPANIVCLPQSFWLSQRNYDFVLKQESLNEDFYAALEEIGVDKIPLTSRNTAKQVNKHIAALADKPWQSHYSKRSTSLVRELWAEDFEALKAYYDVIERP